MSGASYTQDLSSRNIKVKMAVEVQGITKAKSKALKWGKDKGFECIHM